MSGVYEGGLKVWECSFDLVDYIFVNAEEFRNKTVLELGCGQGLPGIQSLLVGAHHVAFHDFNEDVIQNATKHALAFNRENDSD